MIDLMFSGVLPAITVIFELGYEPKEEYFYELTAEQYEHLSHDESFDVSSKLYLILPDDNKYLTDEGLVVSEQEKYALLEANKIIDKYCQDSEQSFKTYEDKLKHIAKFLPAVFLKGTKYESRPIKVLKTKKQ